MKKNFLAGLSTTQFVRRYWQKKPLLARSALPEWSAIVTREQLIALAGRDDFESRIVMRGRRRWHVRDGPFTARDFARLPRRGWTVLLHGVDLAIPDAARLLRAFSFLPYARLDDVMVSYAAPGGGVGPHFDSYDVFLLQGRGRRRWQVSHQRNLEVVPDAPLKLLSRFRPEREWTVAAGDLLYLPPRWAHDGVAIDECITYSIGFRAPHFQELGERFLDFLHDRAALNGMYEDAGIARTREPALIPRRLIERSSAALDALRWSGEDVASFLGTYLSEPKPRVVFTRPRPALGAVAFERRARKTGVTLALATRMLYRGRTVFINGEAISCSATTLPTLKKLANARALGPALDLDRASWRLLHDWYKAGYIELSAT
ncbi:MAG: JmjC domain-containing protein [Burkholderiales bacterium]